MSEPLRESNKLAPWRPLIQTLRSYRWPSLRGDVLAGLSVAVVSIPQGMAYALIAGVPPHYGIYSAVFQSVIGCLFNSQPYLSVGPTNTQALLVASIVTTAAARMGSLPPDAAAGLYLQLVLALTLIKGAMQLVFYVARLGAIIRYVSASVVIGFTAGAGVLIAAGQSTGFLGVDSKRIAGDWEGLIGMGQRLWRGLDQVGWHAPLVGGLALVLILVLRRLGRMLPGPLIAVVLGGWLVYATGWAGQQVRVIGALPRGLPGAQIPWEGMAHWDVLLGGALALAILGLMEAYSIGKHIASQTGQHVSANQELFSQGLTNFVTGFFNCIPGSGSFARSSLNYMSGARTSLAGVFNGLFVAVIFLAFSRQAQFVPMPVLAAILFVIAYGLVDVKYFRKAWRASKPDAWVCYGTFVATLTLPLAYAVFVGIFLNIVLYLRRASQLHMQEMVRTDAGPFVERPITDRQGERQVLFLQIEGDLFFAQADELQDRLTDIAKSGVRVVIFRLKRTLSIDTTIMGVLDQFTRRMQERGGHVLLCGVREDLMKPLDQFGLPRLIGKANVFPTGYGVFTSAKQALRRARDLVGSSLDADHINDEDDPESWAYQI